MPTMLAPVSPAQAPKGAFNGKRSWRRGDHKTGPPNKPRNRTERDTMTTTTATIAPNVTVGSVFVSSWGYEQTNVSFYRVIKRTAKMVTLQRIGSETMTTQTAMSGTVIPDFSRPMGEPFRVKIHTYSDRPCVAISSYETARLWDGTEQFTSSWA